MTVIKLTLPKVGNDEYQYRFSRHQGDTLWLTNRRCQRQPSSLSKIHISPGLLVTSPKLWWSKSVLKVDVVLLLVKSLV